MTQSQLRAIAYRVPRLCPGGTVVCLGAGPSLTPDDVAYCRDKATVIAINSSVDLAPWARAVVASDAAWWATRRGLPTFHGYKFCLEAKASIWPSVIVLRNTGHEGIDTDPTGVRDGRNSGAAAINVAVHFGATRILLLGYDCQKTDKGREHWHDEHPRPLRGNSPYPVFRDMFATQVEPLRQLGVEVINCSRATALDCFPRQSLAEALP